MPVSGRGVALIKSFEGFVGHPYRDSVGVWTIGYGHTEGVGPNSPHVTEPQAAALLQRDLNRKYAPPVASLRLPLNQNQVDALVSFVYNVGPGGISAGTGVGRFLRAHNWRAAADALLQWDHAGGNRLPGLTRRRRAERALFLAGVARPRPARPARRVHHNTDTVAFDGTPVFLGLARALRDARQHGWTGKLLSADRRKGVAERYGRLSQVALYLGWLAHKAGFNPANPPGRSTHELRSDGVAYRGPVGRPLAWWQLGLDVTNWDQLLAVLHRLGYHVHQPYHTGPELHHLNFTRNPRWVWERRNRRGAAH